MYWEKLLHTWRNEGNDGLTLPFIIGSQKYLLAEPIHSNVSDLVDAVIHNSKSPYYIKYCMDIHAVIIGVWDGSKKNNAGSFLDYQGKPQDKLFVTKFLADEWKASFETGIKDLSEKYDCRIEVETFSIRNRTWDSFTDSDINFIERAAKD